MPKVRNVYAPRHKPVNTALQFAASEAQREAQRALERRVTDEARRHAHDLIPPDPISQILQRLTAVETELADLTATQRKKNPR